jgi:aminopeptidase
MLPEKQLLRYADVLLWGLQTARKERFRKQDIVLVRFGQPALRLAEILHRRLLEMGLNPVLRFTPTAVMERDFYRRARPRQLAFMPPGEKELCQRLSGSIMLFAPESLTHLGGIDPDRIARALVARKPYRDLLDQRDQQGLFGWTLCLLPTPELARQAGLSLADYSRQVAQACFLNRTQPVAHWREIHRQAQSIKQWLDRLPIRHLRVESAHTDLIVTPGDRRRWLGLSGHNIPSFEIFTSPDWRGTRGTFFADQPSFRSGHRVEGVRLEFARGRVVTASALAGEAFLRRQLAMDRAAARLGEFSLTDRRFSRISAFMANTLFDENYGGPHGNCHVALGSAYSDAFVGEAAELTPALKRRLGFNDSSLHWDLVNTADKRVSARLETGGTLTIYENGRFTC